MLTLDPCNKFSANVLDYTTFPQQEAIVAALGILPYWILSAPGDVKTHLAACYPFFTPLSIKGELADDGTFTYPGDPPAYPLARITLPDEVIYIYQYSVVISTRGWTARID